MAWVRPARREGGPLNTNLFVALISPEDLYKACQQFEPLQIPFRLRRFPSGLLVVHSLDMDDERAAKRVLRLVKDHNGCLTALRLSELEGLALTVATEQLLVPVEHALLFIILTELLFISRYLSKRAICVVIKDLQD